ncbi:dienelactone hydrolase [Amniculicola lignicola CBS 123094]|uniref:Dienelactone hydrolase n=1 Tax=Amniculicola lignicola CBS 123094 TaxID=1392246 RepID=A0A6A5W8G6_9PLEO|nr:dienelactone hydrolase [Amniculicola lignicola CBS 123094]
MTDTSTSHPPACCTNTPTPTPYTPKGTYTTLSSLPVYITGPHSATTAILFIYDIFGLAPQTLQAADLLSTLTNSLILMPDFFQGEPLDAELFPIDTEEKRNVFATFVREKGDVGRAVEKALEVQREAAAGERYKGVESWGAFGLCWGGKITALLAGVETPFRAAGTAHPGRLDLKDAEAASIPYICLFSKEDGTPEVMEAYGEALKKNAHGEMNVVEKFGDMHHGWMGARVKLEDEAGKREFERGYRMVGEFFSRHLSL